MNQTTFFGWRLSIGDYKRSLRTIIQQIITLSKYKKLSATKDFLRRRHRYEKYLIVDSSFYKCGLGDKTTALILNSKDYFKVSFLYFLKLEMLVYNTM